MRRSAAYRPADMLSAATTLVALAMAVSQAGEPAQNAAFLDEPAAGVASVSDAASATETEAVESTPTDVAGLERPLEIPPLSAGSNPFEGDFQTRQYILGDWGGARTGLAESGLSLDVLATHFWSIGDFCG